MSPTPENLVAEFLAAVAPATPPAGPDGALGPVGVSAQVVAFARRGVHWEATVPPAQLVVAGRWFATRGCVLDTITGVDWLAQGEMEVVYDFFHPLEFWRAAVRTRVPRERPELPTLSEVFPGANWHERETHEFFGIRFTGHPNLTPLLLPEDADFHPLRKDYAP